MPGHCPRIAVEVVQNAEAAAWRVGRSLGPQQDFGRAARCPLGHGQGCSAILLVQWSRFDTISPVSYSWPSPSDNSPIPDETRRQLDEFFRLATEVDKAITAAIPGVISLAGCRCRWRHGRHFRHRAFGRGAASRSGDRVGDAGRSAGHRRVDVGVEDRRRAVQRVILQLGRACWSLAMPSSVTWVSVRSKIGVESEIRDAADPRR